MEGKVNCNLEAGREGGEPDQSAAIGSKDTRSYLLPGILAKGAALGTVLAFMMAVIGLSLPEMIILRKVLKVRLVATFAGVVGVGILIVGYLFNLVL